MIFSFGVLRLAAAIPLNKVKGKNIDDTLHRAGEL